MQPPKLEILQLVHFVLMFYSKPLRVLVTVRTNTRNVPC